MTIFGQFVGNLHINASSLSTFLCFVEGHLLLANFMVERVNEGLVFKEISAITEQPQEQRLHVEHAAMNSIQLDQPFLEMDETEREESKNNETTLLNQKGVFNHF